MSCGLVSPPARPCLSPFLLGQEPLHYEKSLNLVSLFVLCELAEVGVGGAYGQEREKGTTQTQKYNARSHVLVIP